MLALSGLLFLAGCEDQDARSELTKAKTDIESLKAELANMKKEQKETVESLEKIKGGLDQRITTRMDEIARGVSDLESKFSKQLVEADRKTNDSFTTQVKDIRETYDKRFKDFLDPILPQINKVKDDVAASREELIGYMDKQLKDLYPYAYQPKRADPGTAPKAPQ
jgi:DNA anti-recombination protein RmuC